MPAMSTTFVMTLLSFTTVSAYILWDEGVPECRWLQCGSGGVLNNTGCVCDCEPGYTGTFCSIERQESDWPVGSYGLLSTSTGCPESENHGWTTTFINLTYVGNNSSDGRQTWTNNLPLLGPYHYRSIQLNLCVRVEDEEDGGKIVEAGNVSRPPWPRGSYCLVKAVPRDCPTDFRYDAMTLANYAVTTTDRDAAILVDFSADTLSFSLGLCCRDDEDPSKVFHLPTSSAFLLLQRTSFTACPSLKGMILNSHTFTFLPGTQDLNLGLCHYVPYARRECWDKQDKGASYRGRQETLSDGGYCNEWTRTKEWNAVGGDVAPSMLEARYCRALEDAPGGPVCVQFEAAEGLQLCPVPVCPELSARVHKMTSLGYPLYSCAEAEGSDRRAVVDGLTTNAAFISRRPLVEPWIQVDVMRDVIVHKVIVSLTNVETPYAFWDAVTWLSRRQWDFFTFGAHVCGGPHSTHKTSVFAFECDQPIRARYVTVQDFVHWDPDVNQGTLNSLHVTEIEIYGEDTGCGRTMGVTSGYIQDFQIFSSSDSRDSLSTHARLHREKGWCSSPDDTEPYIEVDLLTPSVVDAVVVQGWTEGSNLRFVTSFNVGYRTGNGSFTLLGTEDGGTATEFRVDPDLHPATPQTLTLGRQVLARQIRLTFPRGDACVKMELLGCPMRPSFDLRCASPTSVTLGWQTMRRYQLRPPLLETTTTQMFAATWEDCFVACSNDTVNKCAQATWADTCDMVVTDRCAGFTYEAETGQCQHLVGNRYSRHTKQWFLRGEGVAAAYTQRMCIEGVHRFHECHATVTSSTELHSPSYPLYYGEGLECEWKVQFPPGVFIQLTVVDIELAPLQTQIRSLYSPTMGQCEDTLTVHDGPGVGTQPLWSVTGTDSVNFRESQLISSESQMTLTFKSCYRLSETSARGFTLHINESDCGGCQHAGRTCSGVPKCGGECGYINSPLFPHMYNDFSNCQWRIQGRELEYVNVTFLWLDVIGDNTDCDGDYVQLFDYDMEGTRTPLARHCTERRPNGDILSSWSSLGVEFYSDGVRRGTGFQIKYNLVRTSLGMDADAPSDDGWYTLGDSSYKLNVHDAGITWGEARDNCSHSGGHLVSIRDQQEMAAVYALILATNVFRRREVFIGLRKTAGAGWSWLDGRPLSYTDWYQDPGTRISQPDGLDQELCGMLVISTLQSTATWHDVACAFDQITQFVCEKNIGSFNNSGRPTLPLTHSAPDITNITYLYRCDNGEYISNVYRCDGVADCYDATDEDCNTTASDESEAVCSGFRCGDGQCVSLQLYCDAHPDCADSTDEAGCKYPACASSMFRCTSGQCVDVTQRCDLKPDCLDHSDEEHCDFCPASTFTCYDGSCIPLRQRCDGHVDCGGAYHEDEDASCITQPPATCNDWFHLGQTQPGQFLISPSGAEPFSVQCVFDESFAYTLVHHDKEDIIRITQEEGTAHVEMIYQATREQINALKDESSYCRQFLRMRCHHSNTIRKGNVYWNEWRGPKYTLNSSPFYCCFLRKTCQGSLDICHCERTRDSWYAADDNEWREDADYIFNTEALPVLKLFTTEVDLSEIMEFRLGPLECLQVLSKADLEARSFLCGNGLTVSPSVRCRLKYDQYKEPIGCKDLTHLRNCGEETCPPEYMKCPHSYCVSVSLVCDGRPDCPGGDDEMDCEGWTCQGLYRCHASRTCLPWSHVCDGVSHCPRGEDEFLCHVICPDGCNCDGPSVYCNDNRGYNISDIPSGARSLVLNNQDINEVSFGTLTKLYQLNLSNSVLGHITNDMFSGLRNLRMLDLSYNLLEIIGPNVFRDLQNLKTLVLAGNRKLRYLSPGAFSGLRNVAEVDLSRLAIVVLETGTFEGLSGAVTLTLEGNRITKIEDGAFQGLVNLKRLDIRNNPISSFTGDVFTGLSTLGHLSTDSYMFCCARPATVPPDQCLPPADEFSSCSDLMRNLALRVSMWVLGFSALLGNMAVLAYRVVFDKTGLRKSNGMFVANLGIADFLMGVYMLIIASADVFFRGSYSWNDVTWRHSWVCSMSGFLSMVSAEASVLFLTVITLDRFIAIKFPFSGARLGRQGAVTSCIIIWSISVVMAAVPILPLTYFSGEFFSRSGVCLALPLTRDKPPGWAYSTAIFVVFNFFCFVVIAMGQAGIYREIRISGRRVQQQQRRIDLSVARKLSFIVISDFLCWFPITVMGLVAMSGHVIGGAVYAWVAVFVLPINSALNPVIYTLSSIGWTTLRTQVLGVDSSTSDKSTKREKLSRDYQSVIKHLRAGNTDIVFTQPPDSLDLTSFLAATNQLSLMHVLHVARHVAELVERLHAQGLVSGFVEEESVFLAVSPEGHLLTVWMSLHPSRPRMDSDFYTDIIDYGRLVSRMLRAYTMALKEREKHRAASHTSD